MPFKPGQSGNPAGSVPGDYKRAQARFLPMESDAIEVYKKALRSKDENIRLRAAIDIMDRLHGKAPQALQHSGSIDYNIQLVDLPQFESRAQWILLHQEDSSKAPPLLSPDHSSQQ